MVGYNTLSLPREIDLRSKEEYQHPSWLQDVAGLSEKRFYISVFHFVDLLRESTQPKNHTPKITRGVVGSWLFCLGIFLGALFGDNDR